MPNSYYTPSKAPPMGNNSSETGEKVTAGTAFAFVSRRIYVGTGGNVSAKRVDGTDLFYKNVPSGGQLDIQCIKINTTGSDGGVTTAADIVAEY